MGTSAGSGLARGRARMALTLAGLAVPVAFAFGACAGASATPTATPTARPMATPSATASPSPTSVASPTPIATPALALRTLAGTRYFGTALAVPTVDTDPEYAQIAGEQFSEITPENAMKWGPVEPARGQFDWSGADEVVAFAKAHDEKVRGHALLWHTEMPDWLSNGSFTPAQLDALIEGHITTEVSRYRGKIYAWDVVNEVLADDGTWRDTLYYEKLGKAFVANAFRWAHAADPAAKLYINDYNVESENPKSDALYELVKSLKAAGVPIDGVGFQGHFDLQDPFPTDMAANMRRFADLGVDVAITELDVRMTTPATDDSLARQADYYKQAVAACLAVERCVGITVWGFDDRYSWVPYTFASEGAADLYDENLAPKPALTAVEQALAGR